MKVIVTGASGFLGSRIADLLLSEQSPIKVTELVLADSHLPPTRSDRRAKSVAVDICDPDAADSLIQADSDVFFHLASVLSGHAEADFDTGFKVNFDATRALLECARRKRPTLKFIFTSSCGVYGGKLPPVLDDHTAVTPENTYGTTKALCELLINDYSRKGFVDGRFLRLPTVSVRPGAPNTAVTSFASGIIREPLNGVESVCPVPKELEIWICSPQVVVKNIVHTATLPGKSFGNWRGVNLPGICVTVGEMLQALRTVAGERVHALVRFEEDKLISWMVSTFPREIDNARALSLGFVKDSNYEDIVRAYIRDDLKRKVD